MRDMPAVPGCTFLATPKHLEKVGLDENQRRAGMVSYRQNSPALTTRVVIQWASRRQGNLLRLNQLNTAAQVAARPERGRADMQASKRRAMR